MKVFGAVAMGLQSGQFSLSGAAGHRPAVMTENKKMTSLLGMINVARVVFAVGTTSYLTNHQIKETLTTAMISSNIQPVLFQARTVSQISV